MQNKSQFGYGWVADCIRWRGKVLEGEHGHWCEEWDGLPVDETCREWPCGCLIVGYPDGKTRRNGVEVDDG